MILIKMDDYWLDHLDECEWNSERNGFVPREDASDAVKKSFTRYHDQLRPYREREKETGKIIV